MSRNLKVVGLALMAVFAFSAIAATAAQANNVTSSTYSTNLVGTDLSNEHGKLTRLSVGGGVRFVECTTATISSTITKATTDIIATPTYSGCFANGLTASPATVTLNGCNYTVEATSKTAGQAFVRCPSGKSIEVHIYENETTHKENKPVCTYDIAEQGPLTGGVLIHIKNVGTATEDIELTLKIGVEEKATKISATSTLGNNILSGKTSTGAETATLVGNYTITGEDVATKAHVPVMIE